MGLAQHYGQVCLSFPNLALTFGLGLGTLPRIHSYGLHPLSQPSDLRSLSCNLASNSRIVLNSAVIVCLNSPILQYAHSISHSFIFHSSIKANMPQS